MAEVEKMTAAPPTDIPVSSPNASEAGGGSSSTAELGTSPNQEPSSNSHPHDSEYDTASDLEGGEDYDDDDDDESGSEEESETDEDDVGSETTEDDRHSGTVSGNDNCQDRSVADSEAQKKVDEDRSNPQYIPKRGTFYEHDDRTAETEGGLVPETENSSQSVPESNGDVNGVSASSATPSGQPPAISQASKTMRQWQPASGGDRWSHDKFELHEQAPKSRTELLQSYGYDIRNEDAPPRARRRRRYTRGPSKYSRNWEDEQAYLKASNKERKPPRPQDFPALNERKPRRPRTSSFREEKENRRSERGADKPQGGGGGCGGAGGASGSNPAPRTQEVERERERDRDREREREPKNRNYGRVNGGPGRQNPMEFKPKSNRGPPPDRRERGDRERGDRGERERDREQEHVEQRNERSHQKPSTPRTNGQGKQSGDGPATQQSQQQPPPQQQQQRQSPQQVQQPPLASPQTQLSTTNLSQRLQQVQQRNDPSHVGSVQMHSLANQNQQQQLQLTQQAQPAAPEPRTAPKRYSSLRRSQQEASQHLAEQQQQQQLQQQLHLQQQQQQQQQQQPSQIMIQDPHVLMQFAYQQQEIQAQLQTLQLGPAPAAVPAPPKQHAPPAAAYPQAQAAPYYVTGAEPVPVQVPVSVSVPPASPYVNPASAAYLPTTPSAVAFAQAQTSVVTQPQPQPPAQAPTPAAAAQGPPSMNFHQNYNTVGGTTYFVPPAQTTSRPSALPQRRPTNAIPILPPSEKHKARSGGLAGPNANQLTKEEGGHADNIDHIIDNMFVQRPAFQPPATGEAAAAGAKEDVANSNPILPALAAAEQNLQPVPAVGQE
ncbi:protein CASC3 [Drosophila subobscura]|uniref:protein CASC3 n=1 Tax=Drosophila subobscura TaxID=7241 RepID=UPI00155AC22A|nr:protein CASC3 [Drosophila subobscura]